jgi:hypothetical protein
MNEKRIIYESHNQRTFAEERKVNDKTFFYTFCGVAGLFLSAYLIGSYAEIQKKHHSFNDRSFTNRMERILR